MTTQNDNPSVAPIAAEEERATKSESRNNSGAIIPDSCAISPQHRGEKEALKELLSDAISMVASGFHKRRLNLRLIEITAKAESNPGEEGK